MNAIRITFGLPVFGCVCYCCSCRCPLPDGQTFATGGSTPRIWKLGTEEPVHEFDHLYPMSGIVVQANGVAFSPDGKLLAAATMGVRAHIWRLADQELVQTIESDELNSVDQVAWTPNGEALAVVSEGTIRFWGRNAH